MNNGGQFLGIGLTRKLAKTLFLLALVSSIFGVVCITLSERYQPQPITSEKAKTQKEIEVSGQNGKFVEVVSGGTRQIYYSKASTLEGFFEEQKLAVPDSTELGNNSLDEKLKSGMTLKITRIQELIKTRRTKINCFVVRKPSSDMLIGTSKVIQNGNAGIKQESYKLTLKNGKKTSSKLVASNVIVRPKNTIIKYGTGNIVRVSRGGSIRIKKMFTMKATAYSTNGAHRHTATGRDAVKGVVAVDPNVIPLGSRLYIESLDGGTDYGYAIAADTGGSINNKRIDLCYSTVKECIVFGVRNVKVYVLD